MILKGQALIPALVTHGKRVPRALHHRCLSIAENKNASPVRLAFESKY